MRSSSACTVPTGSRALRARVLHGG